jgi:mRNA-degrading endonuclease toxin of MazEF toxin-antitoxin module
MDGKQDRFERPVIILKVFNREMIWILPITSVIKKTYFRYNFSFNQKNQSVIVTQIRTISAKRLRRKIGTISERDFKEMSDCLIKIIKTKPPFGGISEAEAVNEYIVAKSKKLSSGRDVDIKTN